MSAGQKKRIAAVKKATEYAGRPWKGDPDHIYCYCDAWNLTYPHYRGEHTQDHDDAQALRAERDGSEE